VDHVYRAYVPAGSGAGADSLSDFVLNPHSFAYVRNGSVGYSFSGIKTAAGVIEDMINIGDTGLHDLQVRATYSIEWLQVADSIGWVGTLDNKDIWNWNCDASQIVQWGAQTPLVVEFICPAQSALQIRTTNGGASTGASRGCMLIAWPLFVK